LAGEAPDSGEGKGVGTPELPPQLHDSSSSQVKPSPQSASSEHGKVQRGTHWLVVFGVHSRFAGSGQGPSGGHAGTAFVQGISRVMHTMSSAQSASLEHGSGTHVARSEGVHVSSHPSGDWQSISGQPTGTVVHVNPFGHVSSPQASCALAVPGVPSAATTSHGAPKSHKLRLIRLIVLPPDPPFPYASTLAG